MKTSLILEQYACPSDGSTGKSKRNTFRAFSLHGSYLRLYNSSKKIRVGVLGWAGQVVRHIEEGTPLRTNPPAPQNENINALWASVKYLCRCRRCIILSPIKLRGRNIHHDRFQVVRVRVIRFVRTVGIEYTHSVKEMLCETREERNGERPQRAVGAFQTQPSLTPHSCAHFSGLDEVTRGHPGFWYAPPSRRSLREDAGACKIMTSKNTKAAASAARRPKTTHVVLPVAVRHPFSEQDGMWERSWWRLDNSEVVSSDKNRVAVEVE
ncbi:hypothetical protein BJY52DRAFT_1228942 [Lactarius psammicola]|nr:hypothetical protein BJY52DRAFT_1228942 [Lactarius psammicola]